MKSAFIFASFASRTVSSASCGLRNPFDHAVTHAPRNSVGAPKAEMLDVMIRSIIAKYDFIALVLRTDVLYYTRRMKSTMSFRYLRVSIVGFALPVCFDVIK